LHDKHEETFLGLGAFKNIFLIVAGQHLAPLTAVKKPHDKGRYHTSSVSAAALKRL